MRELVEFFSNGNKLSGVIEHARISTASFAVIVHCFTCGKDSLAVSRVSKALSELGISVLRFDLTGIGQSEGDFPDTNFSSNLDDVIAAIDYLTLHYRAPSLLIGHSLGGTAVLSVANKFPSVKAIVTIGAPATAAHIIGTGDFDSTDDNGDSPIAAVIGGRRFLFQRQFVKDLEQYRDRTPSNRGKALLIMHSPDDRVVPMSEADVLYGASVHPKSIISLVKADHMLTNKQDADFIASVIAIWTRRYVFS